MRYLLDTNVCVDYLSGRHPSVVQRLQRIAPQEVAVSAIAVAELRYGADKSARPEAKHQRLDCFFAELATLDFDHAAGAAYGRLRTSLERSGTPIGPNDMLIAAQALARDLVMVTDNVSEFERVEGLAVENWRI